MLQEVKLLERIELACEEQLANVFENYYALVESAPHGLADNGNPAPEQPAPALRPAVGLCRERPKHAQRGPVLCSCYFDLVHLRAALCMPPAAGHTVAMHGRKSRTRAIFGKSGAAVEACPSVACCAAGQHMAC